MFSQSLFSSVAIFGYRYFKPFLAVVFFFTHLKINEMKEKFIYFKYDTKKKSPITKIHEKPILYSVGFLYFRFIC